MRSIEDGEVTSSMDKKIVYFDEGGSENTLETFRLVQERSSSLNIRKLVLASTTGSTAVKAKDFFSRDGIKLIVVPHQWDFHREQNAFPEPLTRELRREGHEVHFGTMLFHTDGLYGSNLTSRKVQAHRLSA
ncbi:hypothetical protein [Methanothrix soehngenii]|jgi:hypothetical protein|uniref:hypothetical protein n=2 Tax=Methanothrix TaxID=2222 RepID=UPI00314237DE